MTTVKNCRATCIQFVVLNIQRIQVKRLMLSVVAFVVTVDLIALRGKVTDIARWEQ